MSLGARANEEMTPKSNIITKNTIRRFNKNTTGETDLEAYNNRLKKNIHDANRTTKKK